MQILKGSFGLDYPMNPELETKQAKREQVNDAEATERRAKAQEYALLNRPSPPY